MAAGAYIIADEPRPGPLAHLVVNPIWPLFAHMFAGAWVAWPWFALNSFAMGSATRGRELAALGAGVAGALGLGYATLQGLLAAGFSGREAGDWTFLVLTLWRLAVSYAVQSLQSPGVALHEYFGRPVRSGGLVVLLALWIGRAPLAKLDSLPLLFVGL